MSRSQLGWIGVDVGTHTVKLAQAVRDGGEVRLHRAAVIQRSKSWSGGDALALEQPITSSLQMQAALECGGFAGRDAACVLPMNVCKLRSLNVPPGSDPERRTIIGDELAEDFAEFRQPMEFDFWELDAGSGEKGTESFNVSVLAASRLWLNQLWRDCRQNGLDCWAVDGTPLAMANAVALAGGTAGGRRVLAVDWGYSNTTLCVVGDNRPLYSRRIHDCEFSLVLDAIMRVFDVTLDEAQHLVEAHGLAVQGVEDSSANEVQAATTDAASAAMQELIQQMGRTLEFMTAQRRQLQPREIWLMGGGASMRNVAACFEQALELPVRVWQIPAGDAPTCAAGGRAAVFGAAVALSASAWSAA